MITNNYIGRIKVSSPYDSAVDDRKEYKVLTVRPIEDMIASKENPLQRVYLDYGRTEEDMLNDIKNNIQIVVLNDSAFNYGYIPENYIKPFETQIGIKYQEKTLGINLGYFKTDYNFDSFRGELKEFIKNKLGVEVQDKLVDSSAVIYLDTSEYENLENDREENKNSNNIFSLYRKALNRIESLESMVLKLNGSAIHNIEDDIIDNAENGNYLLNVGFDTRYINRLDNVDMSFNSKFGIEYKPNMYLISNNNNELINFEIVNSRINILGKISITGEINSIYNLDDKLVVFTKEDSDIKLCIYDYDFNILTTETIIEDIEITNESIMLDSFNNKFTIGYTDDDNKAYVNFITIDNLSINSDIHKIANLHVSDTPLDDKCLFNFVNYKEYGLIIYKNYSKKIKVSNSTSLSVNDDTFQTLYLGRNINVFKTIHENIYNLISSDNDKIRFDSINEDNEILKTTYLENTFLSNTGVIRTIDRSLIILHKKNNRILEIKKIY